MNNLDLELQELERQFQDKFIYQKLFFSVRSTPKFQKKICQPLGP